MFVVVTLNIQRDLLINNDLQLSYNNKQQSLSFENIIQLLWMR